MSILKNLKKTILLFAVVILLSLSGCSNKSTNQTNIEENIKSQSVKDVKRLAVDDDYVTYYATASTYFSSYIPNNVLDDDSLSSWVLQDDKQGKGEWIQINFDKKIEVNKLYILNGLGDTEDNEEAYHNDNRVRVLAAEFSNGEEIEINLEDDTLKEQEITLQQPIDSTYVKFTIKDTYKGNSRTKLTCIGSIGINYPRVNGNNDLTTNFTGVYNEWDKFDDTDKAISTISKYIDYKDSLDIKSKVQYLANLTLVEYKECFNGASISISEGSDEKSLKADLVGEELVQNYIEDVCVYKEYNFIIESNLIQYYYEGNDWANEIQLSKNGQAFNLYKGQYLNKDYVKTMYLDSRFIYDYFDEAREEYNNQSVQQNTSNQFTCAYNGEEHPGYGVNASDYPDIKFTAADAKNRVFKYIYNDENGVNTILSRGLESENDIPLEICHSPEGYDKLGYVLPVSPRPPEEGGFTMTLCYFVDAYTGNIYYLSMEDIIEEQIYPK